jgi:hypothetical protein
MERSHWCVEHGAAESLRIACSTEAIPSRLLRQWSKQSAPAAANSTAMAAPIPLDAPVITAVSPESSLTTGIAGNPVKFTLSPVVVQSSKINKQRNLPN